MEGVYGLVPFCIAVYKGIVWGGWCNLCEHVGNLESAGNEVNLFFFLFIANRCGLVTYAKDMNNIILF